VIDDNDALAGFVRGANIFSRAERHMIRRVPVMWSLAVCSTMPLQVTQTLIDIVIEHVDFHVPCLICTTVFKLSCLYVVRKPFEEIFAVVRRQNVLSRSTHKALWFQRRIVECPFRSLLMYKNKSRARNRFVRLDVTGV